MVFTIVTSIQFASRKYKNMKMVIRHITTHFMVDGHISMDVICVLFCIKRYCNISIKARDSRRDVSGQN